jgi:Planctomycete cytochrome C
VSKGKVGPNGERDVVMRFQILVATCLISLSVTGSIIAQDDTEGLAFFEANIRPILIRHCYECHSAESGEAEGGLRVDSREAIRKGGERGPAVVPGRPEASLLLSAVSHSDADLKMPPKDRNGCSRSA